MMENYFYCFGFPRKDAQCFNSKFQILFTNFYNQKCKFVNKIPHFLHFVKDVQLYVKSITDY